MKANILIKQSNQIMGLTDSDILDLLCRLILPKKKPVKIGTNFKHFILKRLPDGPDGKVCWFITQEKGEPPYHPKFDLDVLRAEAAKLKVGETKTIFVK